MELRRLSKVIAFIAYTIGVTTSASVVPPPGPLPTAPPHHGPVDLSLPLMSQPSPPLHQQPSQHLQQLHLPPQPPPQFPTPPTPPPPPILNQYSMPLHHPQPPQNQFIPPEPHQRPPIPTDQQFQPTPQLVHHQQHQSDFQQPPLLDSPPQHHHSPQPKQPAGQDFFPPPNQQLIPSNQPPFQSLPTDMQPHPQLLLPHPLQPEPLHSQISNQPLSPPHQQPQQPPQQQQQQKQRPLFSNEPFQQPLVVDNYISSPTIHRSPQLKTSPKQKALPTVLPTTPSPEIETYRHLPVNPRSTWPKYEIEMDKHYPEPQTKSSSTKKKTNSRARVIASSVLPYKDFQEEDHLQSHKSLPTAYGTYGTNLPNYSPNLYHSSVVNPHYNHATSWARPLVSASRNLALYRSNHVIGRSKPRPQINKMSAYMSALRRLAMLNSLRKRSRKSNVLTSSAVRRLPPRQRLDGREIETPPLSSNYPVETVIAAAAARGITCQPLYAAYRLQPMRNYPSACGRSLSCPAHLKSEVQVRQTCVCCSKFDVGNLLDQRRGKGTD